MVSLPCIASDRNSRRGRDIDGTRTHSRLNISPALSLQSFVSAIEYGNYKVDHVIEIIVVSGSVLKPAEDIINEKKNL